MKRRQSGILRRHCSRPGEVMIPDTIVYDTWRAVLLPSQPHALSVVHPGRASPRVLPAGLTLVETLSVVALLAIAMSIGAVRLAGATRQARLDASLHTMALADAAARSMAASGQQRPVLTVSQSGAEVVITDQHDDNPLWRRSLAPSFGARFERASDEPVSTLVFDSAGRCPDYALVVTEQGKVASRVRVSGITGWSTPDAEPTP